MITGISAVGSWCADPTFAVRLCGLPTASLNSQRLTKSAALAESLVDTDTWIAREGADLAARLFTVIGESVDSARPALVGLRRALHTARPPSAGERAVELPAEISGRVDRWTAALSRRPDAVTTLRATLIPELAKKTALLRDCVQAPAFRHGLAMASPSLLDEADRWAADPARRINRRRLMKLTRYLARASTKISPYSAFMTWGAGSFASGPSAQPQPIHGLLELDGGFAQAVRDALTSHPALDSAVRVKVNPSCTLLGDRVVFLGSPGREAIRTAPATPPLRLCLDELGTATTTIPELRARLEGLMPSGQWEDYLRALVAKELLQTFIPVPDHAADLFGELARWAAGHRITGVCASLTAISEATQLVPLGAIDTLRKNVEVVRRSAHCLAEALGLDETHLVLAAQVHETTVTCGRLGEDSTRWRDSLADLDVVRRVLAVFDERLPLRIVLGRFLAERFGPGVPVPFLRVYQDIHRILTVAPGSLRGAVEEDISALLQSSGDDLRDSRVKELAQLREQARDFLDGTAGTTVLLSPDELAALVGRWPGWLAPQVSSSFNVQPTADGRLVLNTVFRGYGSGLGRLRRLVERAGGALAVTSPPRPDPVPLEIGGLQGASLNARSACVPYEIEYPFTVSGRPAEECLPLSDLALQHNPVTGLLDARSQRLGRPVLPLHLGMSGRFTLSPAAALLDRIFGYDYHSFTVLSPLLAERHFRADHLPRVEVGRVVVRRQRWWLPADAVPLRRPDDDDAEHLLRITAWRRTRRLPQRCFISYLPAGVPTKLRRVKPVFVDFANLYQLLDFDRQCRAGGGLSIQEALPDPADTVQVSEYVVELSDQDVRHG
jgi:hypothetical protein